MWSEVGQSACLRQLPPHITFYGSGHPTSITRPAKMALLAISILLLAIFSTCCLSQAPTTARPEIVSRESWGARVPVANAPALSENPASYVVIHHSKGPGCITQAVCQAKLRIIQTGQMGSKTDIVYNFLIGEDGNIYQGRGWDKQGAHTSGYNDKSIGICFIGDFSKREPNAAAVTAARSLIASGVSMGKLKSTYKLMGHRQVESDSSGCPGQKLYNLLASWGHWRNEVT